MNGQARVSIGLPVYNGGRYLREAIDSVLWQSFPDLELIICDNASHDDTESICRDAANSDARVTYVRNAENLGAAASSNLTFELSRGEYFRWLSHDDRLATKCLERCVEVLDQDESVVLCHSQVIVIDDNGTAVEHFQYGPQYAASPKPHQRLRDVFLNDRPCYDVFGLIRSQALRKTRLIDRYIASDRVVRAELACIGRFHEVQEPLFYNRDHPGRSIRAMPAHHLRGEWFDTALAGKRVFPHWRILSEYHRCISRSSLSITEKTVCQRHLLRWLVTDFNAWRLAADIPIGAFPRVWPWLARMGPRHWRTLTR